MSNADRDRIVRILLAKGWEIQRVGKHGTILTKHFMVKGIDGILRKKKRILQVPGTPGDRRSLLNFERDVRAIGETLTPPKQRQPKKGVK